MAGNKRQKASDVFREGNQVFGGPKGVPFAEGFPTVEAVKVEVEESGRGVRQGWGPAVYTHEHLPEYIDCSNPLCHNGGFHLGRIIRSMVTDKRTEEEIPYKGCQGNEGSAKGRKISGPCGNSFKVRIEVTYKAEP